MASPVHLEGTTLEGGGQLLRIAIGLSSLTKTPIRITNIRGKRSGGGGLKAQHLSSVQWLGKASNAKLSGVGLKSKEITFTPSTNLLQTMEFHERAPSSALATQITQTTPGSINLVFQAILPYLLFWGSEISQQHGLDCVRPIRVRITGGTNVSNSPSYDYISQVLLPMLSLIGIPKVETELHSRGWSQGGSKLGAVSYTITPLAPNETIPAFNLTDRGRIQSIKATILAPKVCESHFRDELDVMFSKRRNAIFGNRDPEVEIYFEDSRHDKRFYLLLVATATNGYKLGRDWLYDHGIRAGRIDTAISKLAKKVVNDLIAEIEHGGCVDEYMRDQLVVFQALAKGKSKVFGGRKNGFLVEPSLHTKTAQWVANEMIGVKFDEEGGCEGIGYTVGDVFFERGEKRKGEEELVEVVEAIKGLGI
ncbi:RNA 3'-terminal phosphate cyclase [Zopfia rhizophila CBS 207.26]|uniref:RNA 3'-terminal phosphate cyclase n=1 Tax=Zopfia rhizophila CBS 207.26 TaxID=1314779 RepID=A0A6A6DN80_9PEZI|nr:RNA 3'-terminal phosphate cyclase [Zopfia rhizophila CBS 207.26]